MAEYYEEKAAAYQRLYESEPSLVTFPDVPGEIVYQEFLIHMHWTDARVLGSQTDDWHFYNWVVFLLRYSGGDVAGAKP